MSERSGVLLAGPDTLEYTFGEYQRHFEAEGVHVQHPFKIDHLPKSEELMIADTEAARAVIAIDTYRQQRGRLTPETDQGRRLLDHHLGMVAARSAALLVINTELNGDDEPQVGDISGREWSLVLAHRNSDTTFFINRIPSESIYRHFTEGVNGVPSPRQIGGRLEVVTAAVYQAEGRKQKRR